MSADPVRIIDGAAVIAAQPGSYDRGARGEDPRQEGALIEHKGGSGAARWHDRLVVASTSTTTLLALYVPRHHR